MMSALDELLKAEAESYSPLQAAVVFLSGTYPQDADHAAEELATLQAKLEAWIRSSQSYELESGHWYSKVLEQDDELAALTAENARLQKELTDIRAEKVTYDTEGYVICATCLTRIGKEA